MGVSLWIVGAGGERGVPADQAAGGAQAAQAAAAAQDPGEAHREGGPRDRAHQVDPVVREVAVGQVGAERARRVHRGAAHRARPEPREDDVAAHRDRRERPHVLGRGGGAQDRADQSQGERQLDQHRLDVREPRPGLGGSEHADLPQHRPEEEAGEGRPQQLHDDVAGHAAPGEGAAQREGQRHRRVEVRARDGPHEEDDGHDHEPRGADGRGAADRAVGGRPHHRASGTHQHEEERAEELREEPPPLMAGIVEVRPGPELQAQKPASLRQHAPLIGGRGPRVGPLVRGAAHRGRPNASGAVRRTSSGS